MICVQKALIFLEHDITFGQEVRLLCGERSFSAWLFFANRMLTLSYAIVSVSSLMNFDTVTVRESILSHLDTPSTYNILEASCSLLSHLFVSDCSYVVVVWQAS